MQLRRIIYLIFLTPVALHAADAPIRTETIDIRDANPTSQQLNAFSQKVVIDRQQIDNMGVMTVGDVGVAAGVGLGTVRDQ